MSLDNVLNLLTLLLLQCGRETMDSLNTYENKMSEVVELSRRSCRICLSETEFNVPLFGSYCSKVNMIDKILVCLKLAIEESDVLNTICYKCAENIERYYNFIMFVKKSQTKLVEPRTNTKAVNRRHVTSYVREQVFDADYTFSFLEKPEKREEQLSSPFFSYISPPNMMMKSGSEPKWKTPSVVDKHEPMRDDRYKRQCKSERPRHHSRDLFDSQSQDVEEPEPRSLDWKLTPDDNIIKRVRDKCFGRSEF